MESNVEALETRSVEEVLAYRFDDVTRFQYDLNRAAARRAWALADALTFAREHSWIYALPDDPDAEATAQRCAVIEASARFQLAESTVRTLAYTADEARTRLPALWAQAWEGFATMRQVDLAVTLLVGLPDDPDLVAGFDAALAELVLTASAASFRRKARLLARRLTPSDPAADHAVAFTKRRVIVETADDGMSWVHLYIATTDAVAIKRRATATAKHLTKTEGDNRTRDQLRADLTAAWLRGTGTPTAVKTKVFVTVPLNTLAPDARATVRRHTTAGGQDLGSEPRLLGGEPDETLDPLTAVKLVLEAGSFTRVITDPVTGVVLDIDHRSRKVTRAQYEWLILTHGTCTRDGCNRPATDTEIDHWTGYHSPGRGPTNIRNLHPFCEPEHKTKDTTRFTYRRRDDGSVSLESPTGFTTRPDTDDRYLTTLQRLLRNRPSYTDPPF